MAVNEGHIHRHTGRQKLYGQDYFRWHHNASRAAYPIASERRHSADDSVFKLGLTGLDALCRPSYPVDSKDCIELYSAAMT